MQRVATALSILAFTLGGVTLAQPTVLTNPSPSAIADIIAKGGLEVRRSDNGNSPRLLVRYKIHETALWFSQCNGAGDTQTCRLVYASTVFDSPSGYTLDDINAWNQENFSMAYFNEDDEPQIESTYYLAGGITAENFLEWFNSYLGDMDEFSKSLP